MYAKIDSTTWELNQPARSTLQRCDREFYHEIGCPMQGSYQDCTCYVSRIRLVKTPVGEFIPTTEEDLLPQLKYRRAQAEQMRLWAERLQRHNNILWTGLLLTSVTGLISLSGLAFELGLV